MKTVLRFAFTSLLSVVLCFCFAACAFAEGLSLSDADTYDAHGVYVNEETFPDDNFRQYVVQRYGTYLSSGEIASVKTINCSRNNGFWTPDPGYQEIEYPIPGDMVIDNDPANPVSEAPDMSEGEVLTLESSALAYAENESFGDNDGAYKIKSLKGIEFFTQLEELYCSGNALSEIDLIENKALKRLSCNDNGLLTLDLSNNGNLITLDCANNKLTELVLDNHIELTTLSCNDNQISRLDISRIPLLTTMDCSNNKLTALDLSGNLSLETLRCGNNQLKNLDLGVNSFLRLIQCEGNSMTGLNLKKKDQLHTLHCAGNQIDSLNIEECPLMMKLAAESEPELTDGKLRFAKGWGYYIDGTTELIVDEFVKLIPVNCHAINETNFPDVNFRAYVSNTFDADGDSFLCKAETDAALEADCSGLGIQNLKGLELLTCLKKLNCSNNNIEYLSVSQCAELRALIDRETPVASENRITYADADACLIYDAETVLTDAVYPERIINKANFPDSIFRDYVSKNMDSDANGYLSETEINEVSWIDCSGNGEDGGSIESLQGIELFRNLEMLDCSYNQIKTLDVSKNPKLKTLDCSTNRLEAYLDLTSNAALETVWCYKNRLEDIDLGSNSNLAELWCNDNWLSALDTSGLPELKVLWCDTNLLTSLNTAGNDALETLSCSNNLIQNLNLSQNPELTTLWCFHNTLTVLELNNNPNLKKLGCYANEITELDISQCKTLCKLASEHPYSKRDGVIYYFDESTNDPAYLQYDIGVTLITPLTPDLVLPSSLTAIEAEAFNSGAFAYVLVPAGVEEIGARAFAGCPNLRYVEVQGAETEIDPAAFDGVSGLTVIAPTGSRAETWAKEHYVNFQPAA